MIHLPYTYSKHALSAKSAMMTARRFVYITLLTELKLGNISIIWRREVGGIAWVSCMAEIHAC